MDKWRDFQMERILIRKTKTPIFMEGLGSGLATVGLNELKYGYLRHFT